MRLNEIKQVVSGDIDLMEGVIPVQITMTMEQILRDGKITNNVQYFIMGALIEMFKNGAPARWPRELNAYSMSTSADLITSLKQLSEQEQVGMAMWLLNELRGPANFENNPYARYCNPQLNPLDWVRQVLQHQN